MELATQKCACGHNPEELSTESSLEEFHEEDLLTVTGGVSPGAIGAGAGTLIGAGAVGTGVAVFHKKTGTPTDQAAGAGVVGGMLGGLVGAGTGFLAGSKFGKAAKVAKAVR